jgi:hypothetical protein
VSDELDRRIRALEAERLRPVPPREWHPDPRRAAPPGRIAELVAEVTSREPVLAQDAPMRREDYVFLRRQGLDVDEAAERVGVHPDRARREYEPLVSRETRGG